MNSDCLKTTTILLGKAASVITPAIISLNPVSRFTMPRNLGFGHCNQARRMDLERDKSNGRTNHEDGVA
jgi:hypothetical protein